MSIVFYERVGHEDRRPSPFSWRIRYALAHKGLLDEAYVRPVRFADVDTILRLSNQHFTPIIDHDGTVVHETWNIALYLEERFPERPPLFSGAEAQGLTRMISSWADLTLLSAFRPLFLSEFPLVLDPGDRSYFRQSREKALGCTLEQYCADRPAKVSAFEAVCAPLERTLAEQPYLCGSAPAYADYIVFSVFQMARLGSSKDLVRSGTSIHAWRQRMTGLFNGLGDRFPSYPS